MARLTRYTHKIFGSSAAAASHGICQFGSLAASALAYSVTPSTIMSLAAWLNGWWDAILGGNSPTLEDRNAVDFVHSYQIGYLMQNGVPEWDSGTTYYEGQYCRYGVNIFKSLTDDNSGNNPNTDHANWCILGGSVRNVTTDDDALVTDDIILLQNTTASDITLTLPYTAAMPMSKRIIVKAAGTHQSVLAASSGEQIEGSPSFVLAPLQWLEVLNLGAGTWIIVNGNTTTTRSW